MKEIIAKIDKGKVRTETKLSRDFEVGSSQMFQNFNKSQAFDPIKNKSNVNLNVLEKSQNVQNEKVEKL